MIPSVVSSDCSRGHVPDVVWRYGLSMDYCTVISLVQVQLSIIIRNYAKSVVEQLVVVPRRAITLRANYLWKATKILQWRSKARSSAF